MTISNSPKIVLIGGTQVFSDLARRYADLRQWKDVERVDPSAAGVSGRTAWREATAARLIGSTQPGEQILVLSDSVQVYEGWSRKVMRAGRRVEIPLAGLSPAQSLLKMHQMLAACRPSIPEDDRRPRQLVRRVFANWPHPLLKKRPGGSGPAGDREGQTE